MTLFLGNVPPQTVTCDDLNTKKPGNDAVEVWNQMLLANEFECGVLGARVVRLWPATHVIYETNEADVLREIRAFAASRPVAAPL